MNRAFFYLHGGPPLLYSKVGPSFTYFYRGVLAEWEVLRLGQSAGPMLPVGSGGAVAGRAPWMMGHHVVAQSRPVGVVFAFSWKCGRRLPAFA